LRVAHTPLSRPDCFGGGSSAVLKCRLKQPAKKQKYTEKGEKIMSTVYTISNQKGGCGKTTLALNLGANLTEAGKKV
jgi:Mrp family chromosome partitioning ATPase